MTGPHPIDWDRWVRLKGRIDAAKATDGWRIASDVPEEVPAPPSPAVGTSPRSPGSSSSRSRRSSPGGLHT